MVTKSKKSAPEVSDTENADIENESIEDSSSESEETTKTITKKLVKKTEKKGEKKTKGKGKKSVKAESEVETEGEKPEKKDAKKEKKSKNNKKEKQPSKRVRKVQSLDDLKRYKLYDIGFHQTRIKKIINADILNKDVLTEINALITNGIESDKINALSAKIKVTENKASKNKYREEKKKIKLSNDNLIKENKKNSNKKYKELSQKKLKIPKNSYDLIACFLDMITTELMQGVMKSCVEDNKATLSIRHMLTAVDSLKYANIWKSLEAYKIAVKLINDDNEARDLKKKEKKEKKEEEKSEKSEDAKEKTEKGKKKVAIKKEKKPSAYGIHPEFTKNLKTSIKKVFQYIIYTNEEYKSLSISTDIVEFCNASLLGLCYIISNNAKIILGDKKKTIDYKTIMTSIRMHLSSIGCPVDDFTEYMKEKKKYADNFVHEALLGSNLEFVKNWIKQNGFPEDKDFTGIKNTKDPEMKRVCGLISRMQKMHQKKEEKQDIEAVNAWGKIKGWVWKEKPEKKDDEKSKTASKKTKKVEKVEKAEKVKKEKKNEEEKDEVLEEMSRDADDTDESTSESEDEAPKKKITHKK